MENKELDKNFDSFVRDRYLILSSLFSNLPYSGVVKVGNLIPMLHYVCQKGLEVKKNPEEIVEYFFQKYFYEDTLNDKDKISYLFKFIQFIERQVVLFDAIEETAFNLVNDYNGMGSLNYLFTTVKKSAQQTIKMKKAFQTFKIRLVLTAHPTQFYPQRILTIIRELQHYIKNDKFNEVNDFLKQLGITPFFNKEKPTPIDEAKNIIWYLENVFYNTLAEIYEQIIDNLFDLKNHTEAHYLHLNNPIIELGFWPGGDRDGNPNVTEETTLVVAKVLHSSIINCYYNDIKNLKKFLTFAEVETVLKELEEKIHDKLFINQAKTEITTEEMLENLLKIRQLLLKKYYSLHIEKVNNLIFKLKIFGSHFATIDIRQDSRIIHSVLLKINEEMKKLQNFSFLPDNYEEVDLNKKLSILSKIDLDLSSIIFKNEQVYEMITTLKNILKIQKISGEKGCNRFIISNCRNSLDILELFLLFRISGHQQYVPTIDIIPLFETIDDLTIAEKVMETIFVDSKYKYHLNLRNKEQTIMLGFSDGTKDGGYMQANFSIYNAKVSISKLAKKHKIKVIFFDGRGGPPSRGGGKTHKFYASLDKNIVSDQIQLTIQGQTISSNFGTPDSAKFNIEQLITAGVKNCLEQNLVKPFSKEEWKLFSKLSQLNYLAYNKLKNEKLFFSYLKEFSPLLFYSDANIASRPAKRNNDSEINLSSLRAIPFVGSWSQLKQNVPGYFGMGTSLLTLKNEGKWEKLKKLYNENLFFNTLIDNSMMSMLKCNFELTNYISTIKTYKPLWLLIKKEFDLTKKLYLELSNQSELMFNDKVGRKSIILREQIILPLLIIQQYGLMKLRKNNQESEYVSSLKKLITRSMFGIINAARNSV